VVRLWVPPLRERREDLLPLTYFLMSQISRTLGRAPKQLSAAAEGAILQHAWPGNVRELRNRIERAMVLGDENLIHPEDLDLPMGTGHQKSGTILRSEAARLRQVLDEEGWNVAAAARRLGVERHWLIYRMRKHGLQRSI
jgi:DNA-binding NtrC family response regulator